MDERLKPEQLWAVLSRAADEAEEAGRHEEALGLLQQAVRMAQLAFGDSRDYAFSLLRLADSCVELARFQDAEQYYDLALPILKDCLGEEHMSIGISYRNLAELYARQGKMEESKRAGMEATRILKKED